MNHTFTKIFVGDINEWAETDMQPSDFAEVSVLGELANKETLFLGVFRGGAKRIFKGFVNLAAKKKIKNKAEFIFPEKITSESAIYLMQEINSMKWHENLTHMQISFDTNMHIENDYDFTLRVTCFTVGASTTFCFYDFALHSKNIEIFKDLTNAITSGIIR
jgi:hypothetical protein